MNNFENNHGDRANADNAPHSSVDADVKRALAALRRDNFAPGFEDRAVARWKRERFPSPNTFTFIERRAWQLLPLAIAASLMLAVYSATQNTTPNVSLIARTLGWQTATTVASSNAPSSGTYESVYSTLYGLPLVNASSGVR
jgi:hypothetical protein